MNDRDHAVVVGISKYGSIKPELEGPEKDASEFAQWLLSADGGALPSANVAVIVSSAYASANSVLTDNPFAYEPTLTRVTAAFAKLMSLTVRNSGKAPRVGRRLYIYLSGHGITPRVDPVTSVNQSGLLMANCIEDVLYDNIPGQAYAEWFRLSHAFDEILLFMDCCRTDSPQVPGSTITTPIVTGGRVNDVQVFYALATQWDTRAWEQPLGTPPAKRGVFTYALVEALTAGVPNAEGHLTTKGVEGHVMLRVPELRNGNGSQRPQFYSSGPANEIVIRANVKPPPETSVTLTFAPRLFGQAVDLLDGVFKPIESHTASDQPWVLAVGPGMYVLRVAGTDKALIVRPGAVKSEHIDV